MSLLDAANTVSNIYSANKMRKMENNMIEFAVNSAAASAFYEMKFDQIKRLMIKSGSIFDDMEDFHDSSPVYHCMVSTMAVGILGSLNFSEELFSDISDMEYANKFSKRLKRLKRSAAAHPEEVQNAALKMFEEFGEGNVDSIAGQVPDEGDALIDTIELMESVSDFIGPQLSAEWIKKPTFGSKFKVLISCRGKEYILSGKKKMGGLSDHFALDVDGEYHFNTTEKEGMVMKTVRGTIGLGDENKHDVIMVEISPMGNLTLVCEDSSIELDPFE